VVGGLLVFGLVVIWLFGREFSDRTAKDLLALPTSRGAVVAAEPLVAAGWCLLLTAQLVVISLLLGTGLGLPGWSGDTALHELGTVFPTALLTIALTTTYGLAASVGRGLSRRGRGHVRDGFGTWFPWSVPRCSAGSPVQSRQAPGP
jgi:ABC-2 type transport system permease protein